MRRTFQELTASVRDAVSGLEKAQSQFKKAQEKYCQSSLGKPTTMKAKAPGGGMGWNGLSASVRDRNDENNDCNVIT